MAASDSSRVSNATRKRLEVIKDTLQFMRCHLWSFDALQTQPTCPPPSHCISMVLGDASSHRNAINLDGRGPELHKGSIAMNPSVFSAIKREWRE
jgi:hypothetical protein